MTYFRHINGIPIHYDRDSEEDYGTRGRPVTKGGPVTPTFMVRLIAFVSKLTALAGRPEVIVTGGIRGTGKGKHGAGRAIDLDAIFWKDKQLVTLDFPHQRRLYIGVEAVLRMCFGTVLAYLYDRAHRDHFHVDDGTPVEFRRWGFGAKTRVLFVQAALNEVWEIAPPLVLDGRWGKKTKRAVELALDQLDVPEKKLTCKATWIAFLEATARAAFGAVEAPAP